ncbi:MAG: hypothetical protein QHH06_16020, partial [Clostridiales bacterium]|nr:hypothetical protein [Clostridiales bacterium]
AYVLRSAAENFPRSNGLFVHRPGALRCLARIAQGQISSAKIGVKRLIAVKNSSSVINHRIQQVGFNI